ncbi:TldD/PmbA family protein [Candidatus Woesearchaeota archaeon]|nr:TldD/PmbA family protein [Candidatus Woesearchaeota archaeon]
MEEIAQFTLDLCKDADYADIRIEDINETSFLLKNSVPEIATFDRIKGMGLRVMIDGSMGFVSTNNLEKQNIKKLVLHAMKIAKASKRLIKKPVQFSKENINLANYEVKQKQDPEDVSAEEKLNMLFEVDDAIKDSDIPIASRHIAFGHKYTEQLFQSSEGSRILSKIPRVHAFWFVSVGTSELNKQKYFIYDAAAGLEALKQWNLADDAVAKTKELYENLIKGKKTPKGKIDVICGPEVTGIATHESVGHPNEADRILGRESAQAGESFVTPELLNTKYANEIVNVSDDPTIPNSAGYYKYDAEGVKARKRTMIKKGILTEFLHNRETAVELGLKSNAAARAMSFDREPIVRMANTFVEPGDYNFDELIEDTKKAIYIKNFMEWNIDDKRFNQKYVGAAAYYVENGEIKYPIQNPILELTTPTFWNAIDAIANDMQLNAATCGKGEPGQGVPVYHGGPSIRLKNIRIK